MSVCPSVDEILRQHVTLELQSIDRMYLNLYVPPLQYERGVVTFFREHRGHTFASSTLMASVTRAFVAATNQFIREHHLPVVYFARGQRKDDVAREHLGRFQGDEGILFVGIAQEKTRVFRTEKRHNPVTGASYGWLVRSTAMVNQFYWYGVDRDFGPFFLKFSSYFPYSAKVSLNGHEYLKRQATHRGLAYEPLDNGIAATADPKALQAICDGLSAAKIEAFIRKWLARLPHPFSPADRAAGYCYEVSLLQAEFALTQVLDRPLTGRIFFEEVIRENLDLGRPDQVGLIFDRRVTRKTPGRFRTRVITDGVTPYLYVDYRQSRIKQYHKQGRALRTETTINDTRDFAIGRRLCNLPALRAVGFAANRRLLRVQRISHDCAIGEDAFAQLTQPLTAHGQRAPALRFADPRAQSLLAALVLFRLVPHGFSNRALRAQLALLLGCAPSHLTPGRMTYELRRLRLHGLIDRIAGTNRYRVTDFGLRSALFFTRAYARLLRPGLAEILANSLPAQSRLQARFHQLELAMDEWVDKANLAA